MIEAQQALAQATLTTPVGGTVAAVDMVTGHTAGPSNPASVTVISPSSFDATALLTSGQVPRVQVGEQVYVSV